MRDGSRSGVATGRGPVRLEPRRPGFGRRTGLRLGLAVALLVALSAGAAKIGELGGAGGSDWMEQGLRFVSLRDPAVRYAVVGAVFLGVSCGILGSFLVVRKMALIGDALSHAVLPGVAAGFLWSGTKDPVAVFVGAVVAGLLGTLTVGWIRRTTRLKEDTALGLVLAVFYAVGICLVTMIQRLPTGNKSGIDRFLFGQASAVGAGDLQLMGGVTLAVLAILALTYKELLVTSFDPVFAGTIGMPVRWIHDLLMLLLAFAVVSALQAVGVVLVSAMLITPAAAAYLLTDRFPAMLGLSAGLGVLCGIGGCFLSFLGNNLPTGPLMVLSATAIFGMAFLLGPRRGLLPRRWRSRARQRRVARENSLKSIYHVLEGRRFEPRTVTLRELAEHRRETLEDANRQALGLVRHRLAAWYDERRAVALTPAGLQRAAEVVRNHRLWELYLTNAAQFAADHVHDDAERIEHLLGEDVVRQLEERLGYAETDPHGRPIPGADRPARADGNGGSGDHQPEVAG